ncbi:MAG: hypothetical protein WAK86_07915 [Pseudonocardiaceae bacterium]
MIFLIGGFDEFAQLIERAAAVAVLAELDVHRKPVLPRQRSKCQRINSQSGACLVA